MPLSKETNEPRRTNKSGGSFCITKILKGGAAGPAPDFCFAFSSHIWYYGHPHSQLSTIQTTIRAQPRTAKNKQRRAQTSFQFQHMMSAPFQISAIFVGESTHILYTHRHMHTVPQHALKMFLLTCTKGTDPRSNTVTYIPCIDHPIAVLLLYCAALLLCSTTAVLQCWCVPCQSRWRRYPKALWPGRPRIRFEGGLTTGATPTTPRRTWLLVYSSCINSN